MKTNLAKRLMSIIVAMCLIATFVPAVSAEVKEAGVTAEPIVYSFLKDDYGVAVANATGISYSNGKGNMAFYGSVTNGIQTTNDFSKWDGSVSSLRFQMYQWKRSASSTTYYHYTAFTIKGIEAGEYAVTFDYATHSAGVKNAANVYILDVETSKKVIDGELTMEQAIEENYSSAILRNVNMYAAEKAAAKTTGIYVSDSEGERLLVFIHSQNGDYSFRNVFPKKLTLERQPNRIEYITCDPTVKLDVSTYTYENTNGRMEYYTTTSSNTTKFGYTYFTLEDFKGYISFLNAGRTLWSAFKIRIPEAGEYSADLLYVKDTIASSNASMYLLPVSETPSIPSALATATPVFANVNFLAASTEEVKLETRTETFTAPSAGEYYLVWRNNSSNHSAMRPAKLTLTGGTEPSLIYAGISVNKTELEKGENATLTKGNAFYSNGLDADTTGISYKSTNEAVVKVEGTTVTATGYGVAKIQAVREDGYILDEETITVKSKDLEDAFTPADSEPVEIPASGVTVNVYAYSIDGAVEQVSASESVAPGEFVTVTADDVPGYSFLYWAKGTMARKQVVSYVPEYTFLPTVEATHLIAVYEPEDASETAVKAEFYNGNGQLIETNTTGEFPELPHMAGFGDATAWKCYNDGMLYDGSENATLSGTMIFVAQYDDLEKDIEVTVNGGTGSGSYAYGDVVSCVATGSDTFKCWMKDGVIVSTDKTYTFNAWKNCEVEAVYGDYYFTGNATKLLADVFNGNFIMAEFIGLERTGAVVEKGILIGTVRHAMQTTSTQFTIEANDAQEASGALAYVIFEDGTMITDK